MNAERQVNAKIEKVMKRNKSELDTALIKPMHPNYPFATNGIYLFIGKPGSGKTFTIIKHIMMSEALFPEPYYDKVVFCSTSNGLDKTMLAFKDKIKTPIEFVSDKEILGWLRKHIKRKMKYYAMYRYSMHNLKKPEDEMQRLIQKHALMTKKKQMEYITQKLLKYKYSRYPLNCLVVLDDFAGHELIARKENEMCRMMTKCRHYNLTFIIAVQTVKYVLKNIKRMVTDVVMYKGIGFEDWHGLMKELSHPFNEKLLWDVYQKITDPHAKLVLNLVADTYRFEQ